MPAEDELAGALRENADLRHALEDCQAAREAAERELHDFVYAASHDLQEPLRAVCAYGQILRRKFESDAEIDELTGFIVDGASRAAALVQALLAYSRAGASPRIETIRLESALQTALFKLSKRIRESNAEIIYADLPEVTADELQLGQVFEHLLSNAMLFTADEAPRVQVNAEEAAEAVIISVRDNGKGIDPRFHELIFQPFKRLHGKEVAGVGLGLAVCRKIIAAHGGRIWVESDGQHGSTFKFSVPV